MRYVTSFGVFPLVLVCACAQKAEVGEECLHNIDCDTSYCLAGSCVVKPTQNTTKPPVASSPDAGPDASKPDAGADASVVPTDAGVPNDAPAVDADSSIRDGSLDSPLGDAHSSDAAAGS